MRLIGWLAMLSCAPLIAGLLGMTAATAIASDWVRQRNALAGAPGGAGTGGGSTAGRVSGG